MTDEKVTRKLTKKGKAEAIKALEEAVAQLKG